MRIVIWGCWGGGGGWGEVQSFKSFFGSLARFTNLFFLAMCQIRQHKDSIRRLRSCELRMDEVWNNPPEAPKK